MKLLLSKKNLDTILRYVPVLKHNQSQSTVSELDSQPIISIRNGFQNPHNIKFPFFNTITKKTSTKSFH